MNAPLAWTAALLAASALGLWLDRGAAARGGGPLELFALLPLAPLVLVVTGVWPPAAGAAPLVAALVVALLLRTRDDTLHSECALKLAWVLGPAFALSLAGSALLAITTGTTWPVEQWAVFTVPGEPSMPWTVALSLSLVAGFVLLAGAPFHFWPADVLQGARPWLAAPAVAALQVLGTAWLEERLAGIESLPAAAAIAGTLLAAGAGVAFAAGAVTLAFQRRPERRVGTLASLNGGLALAALAVRHAPGAHHTTTGTVAWGPHLALALAGAATLAPFLPVSTDAPAPAPPLFRRHPAWGALGLYALASLAGVPGTPGARVWLDTARSLALGRHTVLLLLLACAWVAAFAAVVRQVREAYGVWTAAPPPARPVPWPARLALLVAAVALVATVAAVPR